MKKSIGRLVSILYRKNQVYLDIALKPLNITAAELPFIARLFARDGVSQEYLSSYLSIDKAATAKAVKSLALKGYVRKDKNPSDKRANQIYITEYALKQKDEIMKRLREWTEILTQGIDKAEVDTMHTVLEKMVNRVEDWEARRHGEDA